MIEAPDLKKYFDDYASGESKEFESKNLNQRNSSGLMIS